MIMPPQTNSQKLRIAVVSKSNADGGGASRVAELLARQLQEVEGVEAHHWMGYPPAQMEPHMRAMYGGKWFRLFRRACEQGSRAVGLPDFLTPEGVRFWRRHGDYYDLYHFHDISSAFSPVAMRWLAKKRPVAWTFHDCSPFTAGCLYPMECTKFQTRCGACPQLGTWPLLAKIDLTGPMQDYKRETAKLDTLHPITPSNWMADLAMTSGMFAQRPRVIANSVDPDIYQPHDKAAARALLGLPQDKFLVLLSAGHLGDTRKGTKYALEALRALNRPVAVLALGGKDPAVLREMEGFEFHLPGYIREPRFLAQYYAAADVYLFPSLADNLPCSILETMACGTPIVGFASGGIVDEVEHQTTGWLAETKDVAGLVQGLQLAYDRPDVRRQWGAAGREKAVREFSPQQFLDEHLEFYRRIVDRRAAAPAKNDWAPVQERAA